MVLEAILNPKSAENKPWTVLVLSMLLTALAIFLANIIFPSQASILSISFIAMFFIPFFQRLFRFEEEKDEIIARKHMKHESIFKRHQKAICVYSMFFIGIIIVYTLVFTFVPSLGNVFSLQADWFKGNAVDSVSGNAVSPTALFSKYFFNNTQVMLIFFILSVIFGAGAVFILSWNASVIAVYMGMVVNKFVPTLGHSTAYIYGMTVGISSIILHAIPEISGYFFAGIGGGILSIALLREKFMSKEFKEAGKDVLVWIVLAEFLIIIGAAIEAGL
ncbi:MAG: stage II sporulation protein M [Candidatus Aenigmarchaeota archaeon]|nr:stage II sporulation protein M [Candidatus Aenigmarchaeota archaeon]